MNPWPFAASTAAPARLSCWDFGDGRSLELGGGAVIMGIVNVTPDSFSDGGEFLDTEKAVSHGLQLVADGAQIVDVGGQSTRPGSAEVLLEEELSRVVPVVEGLRAAGDMIISVDTYRAVVASAALDAGAQIVNDISAFRFDEAMLPLLVERGAHAVAMHIQGTPRNMQAEPRYTDVVAEVYAYLAEVLVRAEAAGLSRERVAVDPGIGFGKTIDHNLALLRALSRFSELGSPVLVGASRKSFIGDVLGTEVDQRLEGTLAVSALAAAAGADIVRVHDAAENLRAVRVAEAVVGRG